MSSTHLLLIRHAHTTSNSHGPDCVMSGWTDLPVSARGRQELELLCGRLRADKDPGFQAIYSSPSRRARETARALVDLRLGPLTLCTALREINCGAVDGLPLSLVEKEYPELWAANLRQNDPDFRWPNGESYAEFRARAVSAIELIANRHPESRVALITHAGVISEVIGYIQGASAAEWQRFRPHNTAITELELRGRDWQVLRFDDASHLAESELAASG